MDTCSNNGNLIEIDSQKESLDAALVELNRQLKLLECQNINIQFKLEEENKRRLKITRLMRNRRPFNRTETGEVVFPGKKEMKNKMEIMKREIVRLSVMLNRFEKNRIILESNSFLDRDENYAKDRMMIEQLDEQYCKLKNEFDTKLLNVAKYRTKMDSLRKELDANKKILEGTRTSVNGLTSQLERFISSTFEDQQIDREKELGDAKDHLESLKLIVKRGTEELKEKKKLYTDALNDKEYKKYRADKLCQEKTRIAVDVEDKFGRIKKYFEKRLRDVEKLPAALHAVQLQLEVQRNIKTSVENTIEVLNKRLKTIAKNPYGEFANNLKKLEMLTAKNINLKKEQEIKEKTFAEIQCKCEQTQRNINLQKTRLDEINTKTLAKINETWEVYNAPAKDYLRSIDLFQNIISKIKAYCCHENGNQHFFSDMIRETTGVLDVIFKDTRHIIDDMSSVNR